MTVFRIEKTKDYTVMSNHHLRNAALSLKAKGLMSQILSLPPSWDYTLKGLSCINRESVDAIRTAIYELEQAGYITRSRERKNNGQLGGSEYIIHEQPQTNGTAPLTTDEPTQETPVLDNPTQVNSTLENPTQLNKECNVNKNKLRTDLLNTDSIPIRSKTKAEKKGTETAHNKFEVYRKTIHDNIEYAHFMKYNKYDRECVNEIVDLMLETVCSSRKTIRIASDDYPAKLVKTKFLKLNSGHIEYVLECMKNNITEIRDIKKYMLAVLFNASSTIDSYYAAQVAHDMASGKLFVGG